MMLPSLTLICALTPRHINLSLCGKQLGELHPVPRDKGRRHAASPIPVQSWERFQEAKHVPFVCTQPAGLWDPGRAAQSQA